MLEILTPAVTGDLTTLENAKAELGITDASRDGEIHDIIHQASRRIATFCGRVTFGKETVRQTERAAHWHPALAAGRPWEGDPIVLDRDLNPVVSSVAEDGTALTADEWELHGSLLYRLAEGHRTGWRAAPVVVEYQAGFTLLAELPEDLERAALTLIRSIWHDRPRDPAVRSESADGIFSASYFDPQPGGGGLPPGVAEALTPWRRVAAFA